MAKERSPEALGRADVRRCGTLWMAGREDWPPATERGVPGVRIRRVAAGDVEALRQAMIAAGADKPDLAGVRVRGGRLGYLAEQVAPSGEVAPGEVLAYGWVARAGDAVEDLGFPLEMPAGEGWIYDCATIAAARGKGLYTAILHTMRAEFAETELERGWIGTEPRNWASQRGIARAGFQKVADVDWDREPATVFGAPGFPEAALQLVALTLGEGERSRVLPEAGIPWIEATYAAGEGDEPEGLRTFRLVYGEQIHWSRNEGRRGETTDGAGDRVTLSCGGKERVVAAGAPFTELERALEELAPGLPWMVYPTGRL